MRSSAVYRRDDADLVSPAKAGVGEKVGGLVVEPPANARADFEVGRDEIVHARAEIVLLRFVIAAGGEDAEIFNVPLPTLAERDLEHGGGRPDVEIVLSFGTRRIADSRVPDPATGE